MRSSTANVRRIACAAAALAAAWALAIGTGAAQPPDRSAKQTSGIFKGLAKGSNDPVKISAARLEIRDKDKQATFSGNVHVIQGDAEVRADTLVVFYVAQMSQGAAKGEIGAPSSQQIRRMEARGSVRVTQNDQRAQGDRADLDMHSNIVTLRGKVVVARGDDMLSGETLFVDFANGLSRMEAGSGRVQGTFRSNTETEKQAPGNLKALTQNRGEPVKISAARLEVRDKEKRATFSGNVQVTQGETEMRSDALTIFYDTEASKGSPNSKQQLRRMEARGSVRVIQKDQRAAGDRAEFDMRRNVVTITGNVVLARGDDVLTGRSVSVDLNSGLSQIDSGGGRVQGMFKPSPGQGAPKLPGK